MKLVNLNLGQDLKINLKLKIRSWKKILNFIPAMKIRKPYPKSTLI